MKVSSSFPLASRPAPPPPGHPRPRQRQTMVVSLATAVSPARATAAGWSLHLVPPGTLLPQPQVSQDSHGFENWRCSVCREAETAVHARRGKSEQKHTCSEAQSRQRQHDRETNKPHRCPFSRDTRCTGRPLTPTSSSSTRTASLVRHPPGTPPHPAARERSTQLCAPASRPAYTRRSSSARRGSARTC